MTARILRITPKSHFPVGVPFEVKDGYNGKQRGTWYYRTPHSETIRGPFHSFDAAEFYLLREHDGS